jgi:hypothetical protein
MPYEVTQLHKHSNDLGNDDHHADDDEKFDKGVYLHWFVGVDLVRVCE